MTLPQLAIVEPSASFDCDVLILGVAKRGDDLKVLADFAEVADLNSRLVGLGVTGSEDEITRLPGIAGAKSIALVGLGKSELDANLLRRAAGSATRQVLGADVVTVLLPISSAEELDAVLEGAMIGAYEFNQFRSVKPESSRQPAKTVNVVSSLGNGPSTTEKASVIAEAVHQVRDLVNTPPSHLYPQTLAEAVQTLCTGSKVQVSILAESELTAGGFGGILGVGQGSIRGPRLVKLQYSPEGAKRHLAFVGKGITFDSGGLSLKPPASMVGMKYDMTGAATAFAATLAVAKLGLPIRVTAWLCIAENLPSGSSIRPNDVLVIHGGKTVEVLNTDAEGRLVMADGLAAASAEQPDAIIDIATLTGAQRVALGDRYVGTMGDDQLVTELVTVAKNLGEYLWPMPLPSELRPLLNSDVADIANVKIGSTAAGMLVAGVFLQEFVGSRPDGSRIPWAHLDIAGPANNEGSGYGYTGKGPTGVAVRTLIGFAERFSRS